MAEESAMNRDAITPLPDDALGAIAGGQGGCIDPDGHAGG
jgi:hypothetical protein